MCGILGFLGDEINENKFSEALLLLKYRGPDNTGVYRNENVILGHNRLSIIDLDIRSNQPFRSSCGNYIIVFNGEIYNFKTIRLELEKIGYSFKTTSDTEVIINAYKEWSEHSFIKFHGMFSIGIVDSRENTLILARDRMGEKPLFYFTDNKKIIFSSEIKGIKHLINNLTLNTDALVDYLHFGYVPCPKTIYKEINKLEPGCYIKWDMGERKLKEKKYYYTVDLWSNINNNPIKDKIEHFDTIMKQVCEEISVSDVSYGAFLSGGVDSSGAVAYLKNMNPHIQAFTIGFDDKKYDETDYATHVAKHLNVIHHVKQIKMDDVYEVYDKMVDLYDEPFNDYSFIPTYYVCKAAKELGTVVISGDGADELFCGYNKYYKIQQLNKIRNYPLLRKSIGNISRLLPDHSDIKRQLHSIGSSDNEFLHYTMSSASKINDIKKVAGPELLNIMNQYSAKTVTDNYLKEIPDNLSLLQKMRYLDIKMTLPDDMLVKVDRASMYNSLEVRAFYLHPLISDFAFTLTDSELANTKIGKVFLKKFFETHLPHNILYRPKMGFTIPLKNWIFSGLQEMLNEALRNLPKELFSSSQIGKILEMQKKDDRDFILQIHSLMFLGCWLKKNKIFK